MVNIPFIHTLLSSLKAADRTAEIFSYRFPLDFAFSKNRKYMYRRSKRFNPAYAKNMKTVADRVAKDIANFPKQKTWIIMRVMKQNHRGDAINFIEGVCDAIKRTVNFDDNYFSVICDWEIDKADPRLEIYIFQESTLPLFAGIDNINKFV